MCLGRTDGQTKRWTDRGSHYYIDIFNTAKLINENQSIHPARHIYEWRHVGSNYREPH